MVEGDPLDPCHADAVHRIVCMPKGMQTYTDKWNVQRYIPSSLLSHTYASST